MRSRKPDLSILVQILFSLLLLSSQLQAQVDSTSKSSSMVQGSWAVQFGIASNFTLTSFKGSVLSVKYHLSETGAIRLGVSGELSTYTSEVFDVEQVTSNRQNFQVTSSYLFYSKPRQDVFLYWGLGPIISFDRTYEKRPTISNIDYDIIRTTEYPRWGVGAAAVLGIEWFATAWLSIHAEYGGSALYSWGKSIEADEHRAISSSLSSYTSRYELFYKSWNIRPSGVWFGASVYL